jgi:hypothetical protein
MGGFVGPSADDAGSAVWSVGADPGGYLLLFEMTGLDAGGSL